MMRRLVGVGLLVALAGLVLTGCSSGDTRPGRQTSVAEPTASGSGADASTAPTPSVAPAEGEEQTVSVARVTLPRGATWIRATVAGEPDVEEVRWTANDTAGAVGCRVVVTVQNPFPGTLEAYRTYLETTGAQTLEGIDVDPGAPTGTAGLVARYAGGGEGTAAPFTSLLRTWLTAGGTKITVSASTSPSMAQTCDPASIAASLAWDGTERPAPTASPA